MITLEQAKALQYGDVLHSEVHQNRDGSCQRWRVSGKVKTWVRSPHKVRIPVKHGLYSNDRIFENDLQYIHLESECPNKR